MNNLWKLPWSGCEYKAHFDNFLEPGYLLCDHLLSLCLIHDYLNSRYQTEVITSSNAHNPSPNHPNLITLTQPHPHTPFKSLGKTIFIIIRALFSIFSKWEADRKRNGKNQEEENSLKLFFCKHKHIYVKKMDER